MDDRAINEVLAELRAKHDEVKRSIGHLVDGECITYYSRGADLIEKMRADFSDLKRRADDLSRESALRLAALERRLAVSATVSKADG